MTTVSAKTITAAITVAAESAGLIGAWKTATISILNAAEPAGARDHRIRNRSIGRLS